MAIGHQAAPATCGLSGMSCGSPPVTTVMPAGSLEVISISMKARPDGLAQVSVATGPESAAHLVTVVQSRAMSLKCRYGSM